MHAIGMRVFTDVDLEQAQGLLESHGCSAAWVDVPHQGRTLHATDPAGTPLEFCAVMPVMPRMITKFTRHAGGSALRLDHYQILTPDVRKVSEFYMAAGFRLSEYIAPAGTFDLRGVFLQRKGNPHDIVFFNGTGPRLHHFAFLAPEVHHLLYACDVAGELGFGTASSAVRGGTGQVMRCMSICATRTAIASSCSIPTTRSWISRTNRLAGTLRTIMSPTPGDCPPRQAWFEEATPFAGVAIASRRSSRAHDA